jgi:hypothetical protein
MFHDRCTGVTWELDTAELVRLWCLNYLGELRELSVRVPALIRVARERGDLFAETSMSTGLPNTVWLVAGDVAGARGAADGTMGRWSNIGWHLQHYWQLIAHAQADLYEAAGDRAFERLRASWKSLRRSLYLRIAAVRVEAYHLRARAALCAAAALAARRGAARRAAPRPAAHSLGHRVGHRGAGRHCGYRRRRRGRAHAVRARGTTARRSGHGDLRRRGASATRRAVGGRRRRSPGERRRRRDARARYCRPGAIRPDDHTRACIVRRR